MPLCVFVSTCLCIIGLPLSSLLYFWECVFVCVHMPASVSACVCVFCRWKIYTAVSHLHRSSLVLSQSAMLLRLDTRTASVPPCFTVHIITLLFTYMMQHAGLVLTLKVKQNTMKQKLWAKECFICKFHILDVNTTFSSKLRNKNITISHKIQLNQKMFLKYNGAIVFCVQGRHFYIQDIVILCEIQTPLAVIHDFYD